jgi:hypothetical protein
MNRYGSIMDIDILWLTTQGIVNKWSFYIDGYYIGLI